MATDAEVISSHEAVHPGWETVKEWAKAKVTTERMAEGALCAATVSVIGMVLFSLHRAMEHCIILGF